jgi:outer membrane murein-binding lipoprotein Lpp
MTYWTTAGVVAALVTSACGSDQKHIDEPDGPAENVGEEVDEAAEDAAETAEEAQQEAEEAAEDAEEEIDDDH